MIHIASSLPAKGMTYEPVAILAPATRRELRLLCVLEQNLSGDPVLVPFQTMRPMPPMQCCKGCWDWSLVDYAGFHLRETYATAPAPEVLARYLRLGQTNALRADSGAVRAGVTC